MNGWKNHKGIAVPVLRANIDTDQILPKQFMKLVDKKGFGKHLFHDWRYMDTEETVLNPDFPLNFERYKGASILISGKNFGSGSSREHAPWALSDFGFKVVIAPSFADIFSINCAKNGIALVALQEDQILEIANWVEKNPGCELEIDLERLVCSANQKEYSFVLDPSQVDRIKHGWDEIDSTFHASESILRFEMEYNKRFPFLKSPSMTNF
ncbi:3-isopropylmalate dehydratase small subunit [Leptospira perolatii]|uniref:3-isopropylmalate dehydratase small subunit n=1 Tax=Leptospira perolatii TaxID=2023191 RepID=A0A2M9ZQV7_9LEPT|nr:3-isopropylmalate dehydratase small subunit [Leptospira perolatii]PJZ70513.1 3-isopropylmalate dehydratase small subunit [Leptospira perolatii]PJZ74349.1 3-isopropylmalate dehydratase small subunit [Leptospira perolatii]